VEKTTMIDLTDTRVLYTGLVGLVAALRLVELAISRRNIARLRNRGAVEFGREHYPWMVAVHTLFLIACPIEVWLFQRPWNSGIASAMLVLLGAAAALRYWVMASLGDRWNTRIVFVPGEAPVTAGPYRWLRHPNYLAVIVEFVALPLVHAAWLTVAVFSVANALVLYRRIRVEEAAMGGADEGHRPGLIPGRL
jgi:methyltransferase